MTAQTDYRRLAVFLFAVVSLFALLGTRGLNEPDEGRYAETAREMSLQENWLVPHLCGVPHLSKPPFIYWITAASIRVFGVNEWAVRLPSALAALGTVLMTMHLTGLLFGPSVSWKSGMILISSMLFFLVARLITTDMTLTFWTTSAITAFVDYAKRDRKWSLLFFYCCLGAGFLTKGPMAFLVPFSAVIPFAIAFKPETKSPMWRWHWIPGLVVALSIGLSWFLLLFHHYPELVHYYIQYEFIDRIAHNTHGRAKPIWFYTFCLIAGFLPWSLIFPKMAKELWSRFRKNRTAKMWLFAGWIIIPWVILHLVVSKLPTYILPLLPPLAILTAYVWNHLHGQFKKEIRVIAIIMAVIMASIPIVVVLLEKKYNDPITLNAFFISLLAAIVIGWIYLYGMAGTQAAESRKFVTINILMLASLLSLASQADVILIGSNASIRPVAEAIRNEHAASGNSDVMVYNGRRYGFEFYLQTNTFRNAVDVDTTLPAPEHIKPYLVDYPLQFIVTHDDPNLLIVVKGKDKVKRLLDFGCIELFEHHGVSLLKSPQ